MLETLEHLTAALLPDYVVLGGGLADELGELPEGVVVGGNELAFVGGFRLWDIGAAAQISPRSEATRRTRGA